MTRNLSVEKKKKKKKSSMAWRRNQTKRHLKINGENSETKKPQWRHLNISVSSENEK